MILSLLVVFSRIHSQSINLQDVLNEHADDVTDIELQGESYFARELPLLNRNLTFFHKKMNTVALDVSGCDVAAFSLQHSSLTLVSLSIKLSSEAAFATAKQDSILSLSSCPIRTTKFTFPLLLGTNSQLIMGNSGLDATKFSSSFIEGPAGTDDPHLSLVVENYYFMLLTLEAQKPLLAGPEVQNVTVINSTFNEIHCKEEGALPTEAVKGVANRSVVMKSCFIHHVDGALSGVLVYGMQASYLTLEKVGYYTGTNAVRFSKNVAFSDSIEVRIDSSTILTQNATTFWPNGGFLYLPHDKVHINMSHTEIGSSHAPNGNGGSIYTMGRSTINVENCQIRRVSAGKSGGFMYAGKNIDTIALDFFTDARQSTITVDQCLISDASAGQSGGFISAGKNFDTIALDFFTDARQSTITVDQCLISDASAGQSGGFISAGKNFDTIALDFFTDARQSTLTVDQCLISDASAGQSGGFISAGKNFDTIALKALSVTLSAASENGGFLFADKVRSFQANDSTFSDNHASKQGGVIFFQESDDSTINFSNVTFKENKADSNMGQDVLVSYKSASKYNVKKKNFGNCTSSTKGHKVTLLPKVRHAEWTDTVGLKVKSIIAGVVVGVCVFVAACIALICVCCCCGCCVACGCGRKKADAYQHVESQPISNSAPPQQYQIQ
ncbi:hypothetical protein BLNAU_5019 [Blattamonas nauphoetae]|uniref:Right handed beta helix domain-containing protein n=1 Tax=Blattamonas nauphoetae TaxID=2049346 RepID=A0ABQ9Y8R0_9EUKA|nr:hypothetical protein BLNAU_5019 [Blattamonas nauphoetae]